jgi:hypothetical protein
VVEWREWRPITSFQRIIIKPIFSRSFEKNFYQTKNLTNPTLGSRSPKWPQGIFLNLFVLSFGYIQRRRWRHIYFLEFYFGFFLFPKPILEWDCVCVRVFFYFASVTKCVLRLIFKSLITQEEYGSPSLPNFYFGNLFTYLITLQISRLIFLKKTKFLVFAILFFCYDLFDDDDIWFFDSKKRNRKKKVFLVIGRV